MIWNSLLSTQILRQIRSFKAYLLIYKNSNWNPANIYLLKVNNANARRRCEICSELTGVSIVNLGYILHIILAFPLMAMDRLLFGGKLLG